jgi:Icc-related predicted phosphoesterase
MGEKPRRRLFGKRRSQPYRIFFATDVHGSDRCFRKFLAAASVYEANVIILGGDVAGKAMIPIVPVEKDIYSFSLQGETQTVGAADLDEAKRRMNFNGFYPRVTGPEDVDRMAEDPEYVAHLFEEAIVDQITAWCELAAERLADDVRCIITPGNDDPHVIDGVLERASKVECSELTTIQVGPVWLSSLGNTNRTPWDTDREFDEEELEQQIREMVDPYMTRGPLIFNFHCPPHNSRLDTAPLLDPDLRPVLKNGNPVEVPVGSTAVRNAIERYHPVVGMHGHIHESAGATQIGDSWCFNPGSDYGSGVLKGLIVDLDDDGHMRSYLFTNG